MVADGCESDVVEAELAVASIQLELLAWKVVGVDCACRISVFVVRLIGTAK